MVISAPSDEKDKEGSRKPVILSFEVANGSLGIARIVFPITLSLIFEAIPLCD